MTINTNYNQTSGGYYQLGSQQNQGTDSISVTQANILKNAASQAGFSSAYLLDLSGDAAAYLNSLANGTGDPTTDESGSFALTSSQQDTLVNILKKYAGEPQTQETFNKIQDDLRAAGLDPDHMAAKQQANDFNPTSILLEILSGQTDEDPQNPADITAKYDNQKSNYVKKLTELWKNLADANDAEDADSIAANE